MLKHIAVYPTFDANKIQQHFMDHLQSHIKGFHHQYDKDKLLESDLTATPTELFSRWLQMAIDEEVQEPIAMNLATVDEKGWLKEGFSGDGLHPNEQGYALMVPVANAAKSMPGGCATRGIFPSISALPALVGSLRAMPVRTSWRR